MVPREVWQTSVIAYIDNETRKSAWGNKVYLAYFNANKLVLWLESVFKIQPEFPDAHKIAVWEYLKYLEKLKLIRHLCQKDFEVMTEANIWQTSVARKRVRPHKAE